MKYIKIKKYTLTFILIILIKLPHTLYPGPGASSDGMH